VKDEIIPANNPQTFYLLQDLIPLIQITRITIKYTGKIMSFFVVVFFPKFSHFFTNWVKKWENEKCPQDFPKIFPSVQRWFNLSHYL